MTGSAQNHLLSTDHDMVITCVGIIGHTNCTVSNTTAKTTIFYGRYTDQPALAGTSSEEEDSVGAKFCFRHALAGGS